ncbi:acyltransferase [Pseudaeromonas sp. ZJS20]|uniref:acyltransferase n=1 Tax=Pseudaeromonas aegiceratis TaxID=3153928 RepID=UPI00390C871B
MQTTPLHPESTPPVLIALPLRGISWLCRGVRQLYRRLWLLPRFQRHLDAPADALSLADEVPWVLGRPQIRLGRQCRLGAEISILANPQQPGKPGELTLGDRVHIGHHTTLAIGERICLGNDVRIAAGTSLMGQQDERGAILLEDGVTLGTGCTVLGGIRIGQGTLVAPNSLVTCDLPAGVYAAGRPARALCSLAKPQE